jgi:hypothetical protein
VEVEQELLVVVHQEQIQILDQIHLQEEAEELNQKMYVDQVLDYQEVQGEVEVIIQHQHQHQGQLEQVTLEVIHHQKEIQVGQIQ